MAHPEHEAFCVSLSADDVRDSAKMAALTDMMVMVQDAYVAECDKLEKELGVDSDYAMAIFYLRGRSRWNQEKENELIRMCKDGEECPNVFAGEF
jgi:hypothetical protein